MMSENLVQVVTIRFSKYGKEYSYLCDGKIETGDYVEIEGKNP